WTVICLVAIPFVPSGDASYGRFHWEGYGVSSRRGSGLLWISCDRCLEHCRVRLLLPATDYRDVLPPTNYNLERPVNPRPYLRNSRPNHPLCLLPGNFSGPCDQCAASKTKRFSIDASITPGKRSFVTAVEYAAKIQAELGEHWLPEIYRNQILKLRTRSY